MLVMARHGRGSPRSFRKYIRGNVQEDLDLGTLAAQSLVSTNFDETVNERTFISSIVATWSMSDWTPTTDAGPIVVGVAHSDYTAAEIEQYIENTGSWDEGNKVQQEVARRQIKEIGTFGDPGATATTIQVLKDGIKLKTKLKWILNQGQTIQVWAYNQGQAAVATTTANVHVNGHVNLWPR